MTDNSASDSDQLGLEVNRALFAPACQRLSEWALIGPAQRAALESFAERLLAAERERSADLCDAVASVCAESCTGARKAAAVATAKSCARLIRWA